MATKPPEELLTQRPALEMETHVVHPSTSPECIGDPPRKYTRAVHDRICDEIRKGNRPVVAASIAGITSSTFYEWIRRGKAGDPHLFEFSEDVELAYNQAEAEAVGVIKESFSSEDPTARDTDNARWWLERARPDGFSKQVRTQVDGELQGFLLRLENALAPELFKQVLQVYMGQAPATEIRGTLAAKHAEVADGELEE